MSNPVQLAIGAGVVALVAASVLSSQVGTAPAFGPAASGRATGGFFDNMRFSMTPAPQPVQPSRNDAAPLPGLRPVGYGSISIPRERDGHYHVSVEIEGHSMPMLVDTGATMIALSAEDADAAGLSLMPSDFTQPVQTANGIGKGKPVKLKTVRVGTIEMHDVQALVAPRGALSGSLLGMSFLSRLGGFEFGSGSLVLKP